MRTSGEAMRATAEAIEADSRLSLKQYNAVARTFAHAMLQRKIRSKDVDGLRTLEAQLQTQYGDLDISVMTAGGSLELRPYLRLT